MIEKLGAQPVGEKNLNFFEKLEQSIQVEKPDGDKKLEAVQNFWDDLEKSAAVKEKQEASELTETENVVDEKKQEAFKLTEEDYLSTYKERIDKTPKEQSERGEWTGKRGESTYIPSDEKVKDTLEKYGQKGVEYKDGIPDFSPCSESTVEIDDMTGKRHGKGGNFEQCDEKCAEQWNKEGKDGKTDWTARDVQKWREENSYSWHERNDMKTCDLIPTEVNDYFGHLGGVAECKKRDTGELSGGEFDE
jgi:hypothetical protein